MATKKTDPRPTEPPPAREMEELTDAELDRLEEELKEPGEDDPDPASVALLAKAGLTPIDAMRIWNRALEKLRSGAGEDSDEGEGS